MPSSPIRHHIHLCAAAYLADIYRAMVEHLLRAMRLDEPLGQLAGLLHHPCGLIVHNGNYVTYAVYLVQHREELAYCIISYKRRKAAVGGRAVGHELYGAGALLADLTVIIACRLCDKACVAGYRSAFYQPLCSALAECFLVRNNGKENLTV